VKPTMHPFVTTYGRTEKNNTYEIILRVESICIYFYIY